MYIMYNIIIIRCHAFPGSWNGLTFDICPSISADPKNAVYSCVALCTSFPVLHHQPKRCDFTAIAWWEQKADTCACLLILFFSACRVCPSVFRVSPGREFEIYEVLTTTCNAYSQRSRPKKWVSSPKSFSRRQFNTFLL